MSKRSTNKPIDFDWPQETLRRMTCRRHSCKGMQVRVCLLRQARLERLSGQATRFVPKYSDCKNCSQGMGMQVRHHNTFKSLTEKARQPQYIYIGPVAKPDGFKVSMLDYAPAKEYFTKL